MDDREMTDQKKDEVREMLTAEQVLARIPVSRTTLFRLERDKLFPQGQAITRTASCGFRMRSSRGNGICKTRTASWRRPWPCARGAASNRCWFSCASNSKKHLRLAQR
jgi:predicted DNA-binding transcriptional regulator AlpA